jgi:MFS family permease
MNRCHAFWSFGFFTAGLVSAGFAQTGLPPTLQLCLMVPVICAVTAILLSTIQPAPPRVTVHEEQAAPLFAFPTFGILVLVTVSASAMVLEGAGADWSAIYMRKEFDVSPFLSGFAAAAGAGSQAFFRFFADGFVERYSPVKVARVMLCILMAGVLAVLLAPGAPFALAGFFLMGVGTSVLFPLAMSAAAQRTDRSAAVNVAALAQITFVLFLLAPPLLGFVAEHIGIRWAFGACLPIVAVSLLATGALGIKQAKGDDGGSEQRA